MTILEFDKVYSLTDICLKLIGAHPHVPKDAKWALKVGILHGIFTMVSISIFYSLVFVDIKEGVLSSICTDAIFLVIFVAVTAQYGVLIWFKDDLNSLIARTQQYYRAGDSLPAEDQAILIAYAERGRWVSKVWLYMASLNCMLFPVKSFILTLHSAYIGQFQLVHWYDYSYPAPINDIKYTPAAFTVIFSSHIIFGTYATIMYEYIGFAPLGAIFILNVCAQLELIIKQIGSIFTETPYNCNGVSNKIAKIVMNLQEIYSFVETINNIFEVLYELNLKASATMIPITFYEVLDSTKRGELCLEYVAFIFTASLFCYVPCYYSDLLMEKGEEVRQALYCSGWEHHFDGDARKSLLIMLAVALRPISIRTIFRTICLDAFSELCHQAYAIFSLINAVWG